MAKQNYQEPYQPRKMPLPQQMRYYKALSNFWQSVADKYPNRYNKHKATIFTRDLERVRQEMSE